MFSEYKAWKQMMKEWSDLPAACHDLLLFWMYLTVGKSKNMVLALCIHFTHISTNK